MPTAIPEPLTIAVAQPHCVAYDVTANARAHAEMVHRAAARLVVFPELSLTGYHMDAPTLALEDDRLSPLIAACGAQGSLALAGAPIAGDGEQAYIAMLAIDGAGVRVAYRKLWVAAPESVRFSPGDQPGALELDGWRLGLAICKDTGTPRHVVDTAALGIDAYVAGTLMLAQETAEQDERARRTAQAHHVWVAFASFASPTGEGYDQPAGCSGIWRPDGSVLVQAGPAADELAVGTIN